MIRFMFTRHYINNVKEILQILHHILYLTFSCPDSPTHKFPILSFKQTAVWPANEPVTHFSSVSNPPHLPLIFETAKKSLEWTFAGSIVARQDWRRFSPWGVALQKLPMAASTKSATPFNSTRIYTWVKHIHSVVIKSSTQSFMLLTW